MAATSIYLAGSSSLRQFSATVTNAQIKGVPDTAAVTLLPAPGSNLMYVPVRVVYQMNLAVDYIGVDANATFWLLVGGSNITNEVSAAGLLTGGPATVYAIGSQGAIIGSPRANVLNDQTNTNLVNASLRLNGQNGSGDYTGGSASNSMIIAISYLLYNTSTGSFE